MLQSMTGFGEARAQAEGVSLRTEIRSLNNRYFKSSIKLPEQFQRFEGDIEKQLRTRLGRGSVTYNLRVKDEKGANAYAINAAALANYVGQLKQIAGHDAAVRIDLAGLLELPGVCDPPEIDESLLAAQFSVVKRITDEAIDKLEIMRRAEGEALLRDLRDQVGEIRKRLKQIEARTPSVVEEYQKRLHNRVQQLAGSASLQLDADAILREVAIFAERCDVNEEIARLDSHLQQFDEICALPEEAGRKLDFLAQELLREANTIGSKANDGQISRHIVEIKAAIDRIKEQVQNVA